MFKSTVAFSVLAGLLLVGACARPRSVETRAGRLALTLEPATGASDETLPVAVAITSLSDSYAARVTLARGGGEGPTELGLPAGLYAVEGASSTLASVSSSPRLVVVAAGRVSSVLVRDVSTSELGPLSALDVGSGQR
jgi:hypothetical protein